MIVATVTTCPQRWNEYCRVRSRFQSLGMPCPLRTFQTSESLEDPRANNNLNGREAMRYAWRILSTESAPGWMLYLEDDVWLHADLAHILNVLMDIGVEEDVGCWYLCNRRNPFSEQFLRRLLVINRLDHPIRGTHGLLLRANCLPKLLDVVWDRYADEVIFEALRKQRTKIFQVVDPVLVRHDGVYSTYSPKNKRETEVNYANTSNTN